MSATKKLRNLFLVLAAALLVLACENPTGSDSGGENNDDDGNGDGEIEHGVRFVHAALDHQDQHLEVYVDGVKVEESLGYWSGTDYLGDGDGSPSGTVTVAVTEQDGNPNDPLAETTMDFDGETSWTAVVTGEAGAPSIEAIDESGADGTSLRFSHFAEDLGPVDVYLPQDDETTKSPADLEPVLSNIQAGDVEAWQSANEFADDTRLWLTAAGDNEVIFTTGEPSPGQALSFSTGDMVHVVLVSLTPDANAQDRGFSEYGAVALVDSPATDPEPVQSLSDQRSRLQIVNAVSDLDAVTVEIDDEASVTLNYQEGSELLEVVPKNVGFPDSRRFSAVDPDSGDQLFSKLNSISAGDREVYVLMGSEAQDDFDLEEATLSPPEEVGTGEVAVFAAHAYHGFEERVTFTMPVGDHVSFTEDEISYLDTNYETAIGAVEVDPNADSAGFASDSDALNDTLVKKTLTDLGVQTGGVYTFVMSGVYDGSQSEPDMFAVEGPWFKQ